MGFGTKLQGKGTSLLVIQRVQTEEDGRQGLPCRLMLRQTTQSQEALHRLVVEVADAEGKRRWRK